MFLKNLNKVKATALKKLSFSSFQNGLNTEYDQNLMPINYSTNTYNFNFHKGSLSTGLGIESIVIPYGKYPNEEYKSLVTPLGCNVLGCWLLSQYDDVGGGYVNYLFIYCDNKKLYYNLLNAGYNTFSEVGIEFEELPKAINYNINGIDSIIFTSSKDDMLVYSPGYLEYSVKDYPNITSMCVHYERLFVTTAGDKKEVWFSDDLNPTNWNISLQEAGFIKLVDERGASNKVISLNDYVYVFRDFGISRITAYAKQEQFSVSHMYLSSNQIFSDTVVACGDVIFFMATDGVYVFDGNNVSKLKLNIENMMIATQDAKGAYFNGKYYLALKLKYPDSEKIGSEKYDPVQQSRDNNTLLEIDITTGEVAVLRGINIVSFATFNNLTITKLLGVVNHMGQSLLFQLNNTGQIFSQPTKKFWQSPDTDLGDAIHFKIVKQFSVKNKYDFTLSIIVDNDKSYNYILKGNNTINNIKINLKGKTFRFCFSTEIEQAHISDAQIIYSVV